MGRRKNRAKRKLIKFLITLIILAIIAGAGYIYRDVLLPGTEPEPEVPKTVEGEMSIHFIDVDQGDAQLIVFPGGESMLIDAGPGKAKEDLVDYLKAAGVKKLDYLLFTHFDEDHIGGGLAVLEALDSVGKFITPNYMPTTVGGGKLMAAIEESGCELIHPKMGDTYTFSDAVVKVLSSEKITDKGSNGDSIVTKISFGTSDFLLTGDATEERELEIVKNYKSELDCELFTASHHGSRYSNTIEFLKAISPEYAIISCGFENKYGHPHDEAMERIRSVCNNIKSTVDFGDIVFTTDGDDISFTTEKEINDAKAAYTRNFVKSVIVITLPIDLINKNI